jgi:plastocyanin domain-containing protein
LTSLVINVTLEDPLSNPEPLQKPDQLRTIDISVNKGYTPASFNLKLGEKVKLKFTRVSTSGDCASEIVFPDGQKISLATGESKTIEYTAEKAGKSVFACSMNMYQGLMIVN